MADPFPFAFASSAHDRHSELRDDEDALAALWSATTTRVLLVGGGQVGTSTGRPAWLSSESTPEGERLYLGEAQGIHCFAVIQDPVPDTWEPKDLRTLGPDLAAAPSPIEAGMVVHAVGIANWHQAHPRCSRCGEPTVIAQGGHLRRCPVCGASHFPRTDPAVIMLATDEQDRALLGRQPVWPPGRYSTLAGFVEPGESLEDAVRREIHEESGIEIGAVTYAASQPWPFPSSLMLGFFARATSFDITVDGDELEDARWFSRDEVTELTASRDLAMPSELSISRWLIQTWHGGRISGSWG